MRPRKKILAFAAQELGAGVLIFAIDNTGRFRTRAVHTAADFRTQIAEFAPDAALVFYDGPQDERAVRACQLAAYDAGISQLFVSRSKVSPNPGLGTMFLPRAQSAMSEILNALRIMCGRKRGPKKADSAHQQYIREAGQHVAEANGRLYA